MQADKIPDEIMREVAEINLTLPYRRVQETIARALMARDKRAAEIAREAECTSDWIDGRIEAGQIATAILAYGGSDETS
ncbi:MAG: hypothetical protein ACTHKQ_25940 [Mesorhizobium sp.]